MSQINKVRIKGEEYQIGGKNYVAGENIKIEDDVISATGGNPLIEVTYDELVALRDNGQLVAGQQYCITDYETTTKQNETRSAGHNFDLIVVADSENELNENARARIKKGDNYFKSIVSETIIKSAKFIDGKTPEDVEILYTQYVDYSGESYEGLTEGNPKGDVIYEFSYAENNQGKEVPVMYKSDPSIYEEEGVDYEDTFFYVGTEEINGFVYDKWRKIETDNLTWDSTGKIFILTDKLVESETEEIEYEVENANLSAWEIKYCLDNDESRFEWASNKNGIYTDDDLTFEYIGTMELNGITYYKWYNKDFYVSEEGDAILISKTLDLNMDIAMDCYNFNTGEIEVGYSSVLSIIKKGKGVIYYMKDEYGNECPYDFKNIQFNQYLEDYDENFWMYTFSWIDENNEITDTTCRVDLLNDEGIQDNPKNIKIKGCYITEKMTLYPNIFYSTYDFDVGHYYSPSYIDIGYNSDNNILVNGCRNIQIGDDCSSNVLKDSYYITLYSGSSNTFSNCVNLQVRGNNFILDSVIDKEIPNVTEDLNKISSSYQMREIPNDYFKNNENIYYGSYYNIEKIGENSFAYCYNLKKFFLGKNIKEIGRDAFVGCEFDLYIEDLSSICNYNSVSNPFSITRANNPVSFSRNLIEKDGETIVESLIIPNNVTKIGSYAFNRCPTEHIYIPQGVDFLGDSCFGRFKGSSVTMPQISEVNLINYSTSPFYDSYNLKKVTILGLLGGHNSTTGNLKNNTIIEEIILREPIEIISSRSFEGCSNLKRIYIPKTVDRIRDYSFSGCDSLEEVYFGGNQEQFESLINYVEENTIGNEKFIEVAWKMFDEGLYPINVGSDGLSIKPVNEVDDIYSTYIDKVYDPIIYIPTNFIKYHPEDDIKTLEYITSIEKNENLSQTQKDKVEKIIIPEGIYKIGDETFRKFSNLKEIVGGSWVEEIGERAFFNCISLEKIFNFEGVHILPTQCFYGCSSLKTLTLPSSVYELGIYVFAESGLEKLNIKNVTHIATNSLIFMRKLKHFYAPKLIDIDSNNFQGWDNIEIMEFDKLENFPTTFNNLPILKKLIIRTPSICVLQYPNINLENYPDVYVPDDLVEQYKVATNWVNIAERIKPLSEYVPEEETQEECGVVKPVDVETAEEMDALLTTLNENRVFRYVGETTEKYINGNYYMVTKEN